MSSFPKQIQSLNQGDNFQVDVVVHQRVTDDAMLSVTDDTEIVSLSQLVVLKLQLTSFPTRSCLETE